MIIKSEKKGFTLVEIMIALVVLVFGLFGILDLFYSSDTARISGQLKQEATFLGVEKIETLKAVGYDALTAYIEKTAANQNNPEANYPVEFKVYQSNTRLKWRATLKKLSQDPETVQIIVTVLWSLKTTSETEVPKQQTLNFVGRVSK